MTYFFTTSPLEATNCPMTCTLVNLCLNIVIALCMCLVIYLIIKFIICAYRHFMCYHIALHFHCIHGFEKGKSTFVAIEFSNLSDVTYVYIAQLNTPITLLSMEDRGIYPTYPIKHKNMTYQIHQIVISYYI